MRYLFYIIILIFSVYAFASRFTQAPIMTNLSMATSQNSIGIDINQQQQYAIQAVWTGAPVGTLSLQVSDDIVPVVNGPNPAANVVNWTTYTNSPQTLSGSSGNFVWNVFPSGYHWVRLIYTSVSGSGTINATFNGKGAG